MKYMVAIDGWVPIATTNKLLQLHWAKAQRVKKADMDIIALEVLKRDVPRATGKRRVSIIVYSNARGRMADPDAYHKVVHDALVKCGRLIDDSSRWLEIGTPRVFRRECEKGITIYLEDL